MKFTSLKHKQDSKFLAEMADYKVIEKIMNNNTVLKKAIEQSFELIRDNISDPLDTQGIIRALKQITIDLINKIADKKGR